MITPLLVQWNVWRPCAFRFMAAVLSSSSCRRHHFIHKPRNLNLVGDVVVRCCSSTSQLIHSSQNKRRVNKKGSKSGTSDGNKDQWSVVGYAPAEEFNLEQLAGGLDKQGLYKSAVLPEDAEDVMHVLAKYQVDTEPREAYIFREGAVVFWNVPELERISVLKFLKDYASKPYDDVIVEEESEIMDYAYSTSNPQLRRGKILLNKNSPSDLERYAFSNSIALSVKLGIWENTMDQFVESIEEIIEDLKSGRQVKLSRDQVLRKMGELFALRHFINLGSDLLDTPDFYWEREALEPLYQKTCHYLTIAKRTKVMNEKMNYCSELMQLLKDHLNDQHHVRLELMIIALIMIEVIFECIHWIV